MVKMKVRQSDNNIRQSQPGQQLLLPDLEMFGCTCRSPNTRTLHHFRVVLGLLRDHKDGEGLRAITCHWDAQGQTVLPAEGEMFLLPQELCSTACVC